MYRIRGWVYKMGFRPKPGTIFFSPSLNMIYAFRGINKKKE